MSFDLRLFGWGNRAQVLGSLLTRHLSPQSDPSRQASPKADALDKLKPKSPEAKAKAFGLDKARGISWLDLQKGGGLVRCFEQWHVRA